MLVGIGNAADRRSSFAGAGILHERTHPSGARLYCWHDELRYLFDGTGPRAELVDPICGMPVDPLFATSIIVCVL